MKKKSTMMVLIVIFILGIGSISLGIYFQGGLHLSQDNSSSTESNDSNQDNSNSTEGNDSNQNNSTSTEGNDSNQDSSNSTEDNHSNQDNSNSAEDNHSNPSSKDQAIELGKYNDSNSIFVANCKYYKNRTENVECSIENQTGNSIQSGKFSFIFNYNGPHPNSAIMEIPIETTVEPYQTLYYRFPVDFTKDYLLENV